MSAAQLRLILFDVGGVLVQLNGVAPMLNWLSDRIGAEELWQAWLHSPAVRAFETGRCDADQFATDLLAELSIAIEPAQFLESFAAWPTGLYPGTLELVSRIPARYSRALLSNSNSLHWPRVVGEMGLGTAFEHQFVSHLTGRIKPDRDAFEHVLASLSCAAEEVLFLDDNLLNVEAARAVGMHAVRVQGIVEVEQALRAAGVVS